MTDTRQPLNPSGAFADLLRREGWCPALGLTRIMVGGAALLKAYNAWGFLHDLLSPGALRIPYFSWMPGLSEPMITAIIGIWVLSGGAFLLGWRTRTAGAALTAVIALVLLLDQQTYGNHLYLLFLLCLLLTIARSGAYLSLDARREAAKRPHSRRSANPGSKHEPGGPRIPIWPVLLLQIQLSIVYGFSALTKLNLAYVSGGLLKAHLGRDALLSMPESWRIVELLAPLAILSILVEAYLAIGFWTPRRRLAAALGIAFHLSLILTMDLTLQITIFTLEMIAIYPLFLGWPLKAATSDQMPKAAVLQAG